MSVTGETVEYDASASKYSYSAIFEFVTNALYPSEVSKEYKRGLQKRAAFFEAGHLYYVGGKTKQRPRMVIEKEEDQLKIVKTVHEEVIWVETKRLLRSATDTTGLSCTIKCAPT